MAVHEIPRNRRNEIGNERSQSRGRSLVAKLISLQRDRGDDQFPLGFEARGFCGSLFQGRRNLVSKIVSRRTRILALEEADKLVRRLRPGSRERSHAARGARNFEHCLNHLQIPLLVAIRPEPQPPDLTKE